MKLEKLEPLDSPNYLRLIFEDGKRLKAPAFKVVELGLTPGAEVTPEVFLALENAQSLASCKERAVRILTASGLSKKELQKRLNALGFDCGTADGIFGSKTENGVIAFQTAAGIEVDGKFGKESFAALSAYSTPENEPESDDAQGYATYVVQRGDTLWNLAKKLLGRGGRWTEIAALNSISGTMIRDGQVLKIPA